MLADIRSRKLAASLLVIASTVLAACGEGPPSEGTIPLPTEQTPRICPTLVRGVSATYPATTPGVTSLASIQFTQTREPLSALVTYNVLSSVIPGGMSTAIVRDSRDTTRVLMTVTRPLQPSPNFPFAGSAVAPNGTVDDDTFYDVMQAGAAEIVFQAPPAAATQGRIPLSATGKTDWASKTC